MGKKESGFTLIELMIVVAVIGILAVLAIASYQDYQIRSQISEAMGLMAGVKNNVAEYHVQRNFYPANNLQAGAAGPLSIIGKYVDSVVITDGVITATLGGDINTKVNGLTIELSPTFAGGSFDWRCDSAGTNVPNKYLPSVCR